MVLPLKQGMFFPQDLCLTDSLTITGIAHIFSFSFLSQHGQPVTQHWPHLQLGLGVVSVAPSAQAALPQYGHFSKKTRLAGLLLPWSLPSPDAPSYQPHTIHGVVLGTWTLKWTLCKKSSLREGRDEPICSSSPFSGPAHGMAPQKVVSAWERDQSAEVWGWWSPNRERAGPFLPGTGKDGSALCYQSAYPALWWSLSSCLFQLQEEEAEGNC